MEAPLPAPEPKRGAGCYRFGLFELDKSARRLHKQGRIVRLQDQPFRLLTTLVERQGAIVSREELRQHLWPDDTFVDFDKSLGVAVTKLRHVLGDDAGSPRFIETIPRHGYRFIASVDGLETEGPRGPAPAPMEAALPAPGRRRIRLRYTVAISLIVVSAVAFYFLGPSRPPSSPTTRPDTVASLVPIRRSVAVLGFRNLPGRREDDWLSEAFAEMLSTELGAGGRLRLVSDEDVARVKRELSLGTEGSLGRATLARLRADPGADVVVFGSYTRMAGKSGGRVRLDVRVQDAATGETILEDDVVGDESGIFEIAARAGAELRASLGVSSVSPDDVAAARASLPANEEAVRLYSQGKAKLWAFDFVGARDDLGRAVAADPAFPLAHTALSDAWGHLGYRTKAISEARRALDLSRHLPREVQLLVAGQHQETLQDWPKAVETYRSLFALRPDNLDYGLRLAAAEVQVGPPDALRTLDQLRALPPPANGDPRIDLLEASAQIGRDLTASKAAAKRALAKGDALGSDLMVARAYGILCQQGPSVGTSSEESIGYCETARQSFASSGDYNNEARTLSDLAGIYFQRGDLLRAELMWRDAAREFRHVGDLEGEAATSNNLGDVLIGRGDLGAAEAALRAAIPSYEAVEDKAGVALALTDLADVSRLQGNLEASRATCAQAKAAAEAAGDKDAQGHAAFSLGEVLEDEGDLAGARLAYERSLALRNEAGEIQAVGESRVALARLSVEDGRPAEAEAELRTRTEQFRKEHQADDELRAAVVLISGLEAQGKLASAREEVARAEPLSARSQNVPVRLRFELASGHLLAASDQRESSREPLLRVLKQARDRGFVGIELDARLALAELDREAGNTSTARAELASLEATARSKGYGVVAKRAAADLRSFPAPGA